MHANRLLDTAIIGWNNWKRGYMEKVKYFQNYIVPECSNFQEWLFKNTLITWRHKNDNILLYITKILNGNW